MIAINGEKVVRLLLIIAEGSTPLIQKWAHAEFITYEFNTPKFMDSSFLTVAYSNILFLMWILK